MPYNLLNLKNERRKRTFKYYLAKHDILKISPCKNEHPEYEDKSRRSNGNESIETETITSNTESKSGSLKL